MATPTLQAHWDAWVAEHGDKNGEVPEAKGLEFKAKMDRRYGWDNVVKAGKTGPLSPLTSRRRKADPKPSDAEREFVGGPRYRQPAPRVRSTVIRPIQPLAGPGGEPISDPLKAPPTVPLAGGMALAPGGMSFHEMEPFDVMSEGKTPYYGSTEPIAEELGPGAEVVTTPRHKLGEPWIRGNIDRATSITQPDPESRGSAEETAAQIEPTDEYTLPAHARQTAGEEGELGDAAPRTGPSEVPVAVAGETVFDKGWGQLKEAFEDMGGEMVDAAEFGWEEAPAWFVRATGRNIARLGGMTFGAARDMLWNPVMNMADAFDIDDATGTIKDLERQLAELRKREEKGAYLAPERAKINDLLRRALDFRKEARQDIASRRMRVLDHIDMLQSDMNDRYTEAGVLPAAIEFLENAKDDAVDIVAGLGHLLLADIPGWDEDLYEKGAQGEGFEYVTDYIARSLEVGWTRGEEFTTGMVAAPLALMSDPIKAVQTKPITVAMYLLPAVRSAHRRAVVDHAIAVEKAPGAHVLPEAVRLDQLARTLSFFEKGLKIADLGLTPMSDAALGAAARAPGFAAGKAGAGVRMLPGGKAAMKLKDQGIDYAKRWLADSLDLPTQKARAFVARAKMRKDETAAILYDLANVLARTVEEGDYVPPEGTALMPESVAQAAVQRKAREEGVTVDDQLSDEGVMPERRGGAAPREYAEYGPGEIPPLAEWTWADSDGPGSGRRRLSRNHPTYGDEVARVQEAVDKGWEQEQASRAAELEAMTPEQRQYEKEKHMARFLQYEGLTRDKKPWQLRPPEKKTAEPAPQAERTPFLRQRGEEAQQTLDVALDVVDRAISDAGGGDVPFKGRGSLSERVAEGMGVGVPEALMILDRLEKRGDITEGQPIGNPATNTITVTGKLTTEGSKKVAAKRQEPLAFDDGTPIPPEPGETLQQTPEGQVYTGRGDNFEQRPLADEAPPPEFDQLEREMIERGRERDARDAEPGMRFDSEQRPEWTPQLKGAVRDRYGIYEHEFPEFARTVDEYLERKYPNQGVRFTEATPSKEVSVASQDFFNRQGHSAVEAAIRGGRYPMSAGEYSAYARSVVELLQKGKSLNKAQRMSLASHLNETGTLNPATGMRWSSAEGGLRLGILDETVDAGVAPRRTISEFESARALAEMKSTLDQEFPVRPDDQYSQAVSTGVMTRAQQLALRFAEEGENATALGEMVAHLERVVGKRLDDPVDPTATKAAGPSEVTPPPGGWYDPETFGLDEGAPTAEGQTTFSFARPAKFGPAAAEAINTAAKKLGLPAKLLASHFLDALDYQSSGKVLNSNILRDRLKVAFEEWMDHKNVPDAERKALRESLNTKASSMAKGEYLTTNQAVAYRKPTPYGPKRKPGAPSNDYFHILPQAQKILEEGGDWGMSLAEKVADVVASDIAKMPVSKKNKALSAAIMKMGFDLADELVGGVQRKQMYQEVLRAPDTAAEAVLRSVEDLAQGGDGVPAVMTIAPADVSAALLSSQPLKTWSKGGKVRQLAADALTDAERAQVLQMYDPEKWVQVDPALMGENGFKFTKEQLETMHAVDENGQQQRQIYMRKPMHEAMVAEMDVRSALDNIGWMDKIVRTAKRSLVPLSLMTTAGNLMSDYMITVVNEGNPLVYRKVSQVDTMMADIDSGRMTRADNPELYDKIRRLKWTGLLESTVLDVELGHQVHQGVMDLGVLETMFGADENRFGKYHRLKNTLEKQINEPQLRAFRRGTNAFKAYSALRAWDAMQLAAEGHAIGETFTMYPTSQLPVVMRRVGDVDGKPTFAVDKTNKVMTPEQWEMALARNAKVSSDRMFADYSRGGLLVKKLKTMPAANLVGASMFAMYFLHSAWIPGIKRGVSLNMFDPNPAFIPTNKKVKAEFQQRLIQTNLRSVSMAAGANANQIQATDWLRSQVGFRRREDAWAAFQLTGNPYVMNVWNWGNLDVFTSTRNAMSAIQSGLISFGSSGLELWDESPDEELSVLYPGGGPGKNLEYKLEAIPNKHERAYIKKMREWKNKDLSGGVYNTKNAFEMMFLGGGPALDLISDIVASEKTQIPMNWTNIAGKFTNSVIGATAGRFVHVAVGMADPGSSFSNLRFTVRDPALFGRRELDEQDAVKFQWAVRQITMKGWQSQNLKARGVDRYIKDWARAWQQSVIKPVRDSFEALHASKDPADRARAKIARKNLKRLKKVLADEKKMLRDNWKRHVNSIKHITEEAQRAPLRVKPTPAQRQELKKAGEKGSTKGILRTPDRREQPGPRAEEWQMKNLHNQKNVDEWINSQPRPETDAAVRRKAGRQKNRAAALQKMLEKRNEERAAE